MQSFANKELQLFWQEQKRLKRPKCSIIITQDATLQEQIADYPNQTQDFIFVITRQTWKCGNVTNTTVETVFSSLFF